MKYLRQLTDYLKSTKLEAKNVNWPSKKDTLRFTILVIVISVIISLFLGLVDFLSVSALERLIL